MAVTKTKRKRKRTKQQEITPKPLVDRMLDAAAHCSGPIIQFADTLVTQSIVPAMDKTQTFVKKSIDFYN